MSSETLHIPMTELGTLAALDAHVVRTMILEGKTPAVWTASIQALKAARWYKHGAYTVMEESEYRPGVYLGQLYALFAPKPVVREWMRNCELRLGPVTLVAFSAMTQDPWLACFMFSIAHGYSKVLGDNLNNGMTVDISDWPRPRRMRKRGGK